MQFTIVLLLQSLLSWVWNFSDSRALAEEPLIFPSSFNGTTVTDANSPLRILTHNIRYAATFPGINEAPWSIRKSHIMGTLISQTTLPEYIGDEVASVICLQEVLHHQLVDILAALNGGDLDVNSERQWAHIGVGRDNGKTKGEYSPIIYPTRLLRLLHTETRWLSATPGRPSKGWDAAQKRIITIGVFEHKQTGQRLLAANTHLDDAGSIARKESAQMILATLSEMSDSWAAPSQELLRYFLTGDFNSLPEQEAYQTLNSSNNVVDVMDVVPKTEIVGAMETFTGFQPDTNIDKEWIGRLDFIWLGPRARVGSSSRADSRWEVKRYSVLPNLFGDGVFSSDHRAVIADTMVIL